MSKKEMTLFWNAFFFYTQIFYLDIIILFKYSAEYLEHYHRIRCIIFFLEITWRVWWKVFNALLLITELSIGTCVETFIICLTTLSVFWTFSNALWSESIYSMRWTLKKNNFHGIPWGHKDTFQNMFSYQEM